MQWYLAAMKKYADFNGRARRMEYWMFALVYIVVYAALLICGFGLAKTGHPALLMPFMGLAVVWALAHFVPSLAVGARRLHDSGKSAWLLLIMLVPVIGPIALLVLYCLDSTPGVNEYGENPKGVGEVLAA